MAQYKNSGMDAAAREDNAGVPLFFSGDGSAYLCPGAHAATQINHGAKLLYHPDAARTAAPAKNGTPSIFSGERAATRTNDGTEHLHPDASDAVAGEPLPLASQVFGGKTASVLGAFAERLRHGLPVLGLSVASLAVIGLAAGEPTPAVGFGLFVMLIAGLSAVTIPVLRA